MSRVLGIAGKIVVVGVILGVAGFFLGRYAARKTWESERARLVADNESMTSELNSLKEYVRKTRQAANEIRARVNPRSTMPVTSAPPYPMFSNRSPGVSPGGVAPIPPWSPPRPATRPGRQRRATSGPSTMPVTAPPTR